MSGAIVKHGLTVDCNGCGETPTMAGKREAQVDVTMKRTRCPFDHVTLWNNHVLSLSGDDAIAGCRPV
jgi:hypothetical protein